MQKKADNFWQILGFCLPTIQRFAQFFCQRNWINIFFWRKNENIFGKTLDFVNQRPCGFGNFLPQKSGLAFFCQKTKIFLAKSWILSMNDLVVLAIFYAQKEWIGIFFAKKRNYFWQKLGFRLPTTKWFWQIFRQKRVDWHFFCQKTKIGTTSKLAKTRKMRFWSTCFDLLTKIKICAHSRGMILC